MEQTTNFNLRKYQSGDLFNPLTVDNPNLDDIDKDMKAISDRAIGRATELVSQGVHAINLLDTDCKTFKFVATGNFTAGETFTVNGIQCNAYTPSGSALTSNAFVTGSIVIGSLNEDGTAITFYVTGSAVADDSLKLGGELPSYYATQSDMTDVKTNITNLKNQAGNTSIVGIGDGTLSGAVSSLNNDLTVQTLWTNSDPTSSFNSQSVILSESNYSMFIVECVGNANSSSSAHATTLALNKDIKYTVVGDEGNPSENIYRKFTINSNDTVSFEDGHIGNGVFNTILVPYKIYGVFKHN